MPHVTIVPTAQQVSSAALFQGEDPSLPGRLAPDADSLAPVVVVDALRATSTIASALAAGVRGVIPVATVDEARVRRADHVKIAGERGGDRLPGFDFGNSPVDIAGAAGSFVVLTTTNGTLATRRIVDAAGRAGRRPVVYAGAFVNRRRVAQALVAAGRGVVIVCAGQDGHPAGEDLLAAGAIASLLPAAWHRDDLAVTAEWAFAGAVGSALNGSDAAPDRTHRDLGLRHALRTALARCPHGSVLAAKGYGADLDACAALDSLDVLPQLQERGDDWAFVASGPSLGG